MSESTDRPSGITVIGDGTAPAAVDQVCIQLGVEILRDAPGDAFRAAAATVTGVLTILADAGVSARSVRTSDLTLGPRLDYDQGRQRLLGYQAGQRLTVLLQGLDGIEPLLTRIATLGGEGVRIDGVTLTAGHPEEAEAAAREAAMREAGTKAAHLATLAGRTLGRVESIDERPPGGVPRPMAKTMALATEAMPVAAGDAQVQVSLQVSYSFAG